MGKLSREDAVRLVRTPVHGIFTYEQTAVDRILEYSACEPSHHSGLCVHAINRIIEAKRRGCERRTSMPYAAGDAGDR